MANSGTSHHSVLSAVSAVSLLCGFWSDQQFPPNHNPRPRDVCVLVTNHNRHRMATHCGEVDSWNEKLGWGFIRPDDLGPCIFVHHRSLHSRGFRKLIQGQRVWYEVSLGSQGRLEAVEVTGPAGSYVEDAAQKLASPPVPMSAGKHLAFRPRVLAAKAAAARPARPGAAALPSAAVVPAVCSSAGAPAASSQSCAPSAADDTHVTASDKPRITSTAPLAAQSGAAHTEHKKRRQQAAQSVATGETCIEGAQAPATDQPAQGKSKKKARRKH
jgi:cold shock protein